LSDPKNKPCSLTLVGAGNLAWHLAHVFSEKGLKIHKIINHSKDNARMLASEIGTVFTTDFKVSNADSEFTILAISDSFLESTIKKIDLTDTIVIHTSGSTNLELFKGRATRFGVLYPVQSFTKGIKIDFSTIPVCI
jgi:predicted short-subunit dehydrogenase-like oxidoreductase (DUF2520 family)